MKQSSDAPNASARCLCACGNAVRPKRRFRQGHDATYYSRLRKVERGERRKEDLPLGMRQNLDWQKCAVCNGWIPTADPWGTPIQVGVACRRKKAPALDPGKIPSEAGGSGPSQTPAPTAAVGGPPSPPRCPPPGQPPRPADPDGRYDHHEKAGNQGDVVKHVALIAALDATVESFPSGKTFRYADTFAGYACNPLVCNPRYEWRKGIGRFREQFKERLQQKPNEHARLWYDWYLAARPQLLGGIYPGSSLIASDVCAARKAPVHLALWDTSPKVIENLMTVFAGRDCEIYTRTATFEECDVKAANFLLIDPPNVTERNWKEIHRFLQGGPPVLLWLPVFADTSSSPPREHARSEGIRKEATATGCKATKVVWAKGGRMIGCQLIYRLSNTASKALRDAVDALVSIAPAAHGVKWTCSHHL